MESAACRCDHPNQTAKHGDHVLPVEWHQKTPTKRQGIGRLPEIDQRP